MINANEVPKLAIGHAVLESQNVEATVEFLTDLGVRVVINRGGFAIVELRGGTHVVIRQVTSAPAQPTFDLMVDDVVSLRDQITASGAAPSALRRGGVHQSFDVMLPGASRLTFTSSHAMGRV